MRSSMAAGMQCILTACLVAQGQQHCCYLVLAVGRWTATDMMTRGTMVVQSCIVCDTGLLALLHQLLLTCQCNKARHSFLPPAAVVVSCSIQWRLRCKLLTSCIECRCAHEWGMLIV